MISRRQFMKCSAQASVAAATSPLWCSQGIKAFAQGITSDYKALVVITLEGGNDANNMLVPLESQSYREYATVRGVLAQQVGNCIPLQHDSGQPAYGLHPSLPGVANLYNMGRALFVANVGPIRQPTTKQMLQVNASLAPDLFSHPSAVAQWESSLTYSDPATGWGGRMADLIANRSGSLPPVLSESLQSLFSVGNTVQAVAVQATGSNALTPDLNNVIARIAQNDTMSTNALVAQAAKVRVASMAQQAILDRASSYQVIKTQFPTTDFGQKMLRTALLIAGRSVIGASRQIFYTQQGNYDSHTNQLQQQGGFLSELDGGLTALMQALDELGMSDKVLVCTLSDFNRTFQPNVNGGSDHGWGTHQMILGGGIKGRRILGTMPTLELNGPDDLNGSGAWIPTTATTQLTGGLGHWLGLDNKQIASVFPELSAFPSGALNYLAG